MISYDELVYALDEKNGKAAPRPQAPVQESYETFDTGAALDDNFGMDEVHEEAIAAGSLHDDFGAGASLEDDFGGEPAMDAAELDLVSEEPMDVGGFDVLSEEPIEPAPQAEAAPGDDFNMDDAFGAEEPHYDYSDQEPLPGEETGDPLGLPLEDSFGDLDDELPPPPPPAGE